MRAPVDRGFGIIRLRLTTSVTEFDQHGFDANRAAIVAPLFDG